jgi:hypothetical protein
VAGNVPDGIVAARGWAWGWVNEDGAPHLVDLSDLAHE